ncbi:MAG: Fur family transcriptional regulator [Paenibacillaceae bacterium]|nr:Fur family transcriptional regulator [Paenibacillaceae bacterium]
MAHTVNHEQIVEEIVRSMADKGWRITGQRRRLAELFASAEGYLSAKDVYEHMRIEFAGISFDTVYRNLRLLSDMGVLEQFHLADGIKFRARCLMHHHHHMICLGCERTYTFEFCPMKHLPELPEHFQIRHHRFDIFGYCDECSPKLPAEPGHDERNQGNH